MAFIFYGKPPIAGRQVVSGMVTDATGVVTHLNKPYAKFLGLDAEDSIGKHCTDVVENTRMHIVARTGIPEINQTQAIRGQNIVAHRIPIKKENRVIAVFGLVMFQDVGKELFAQNIHHVSSRCIHRTPL